MDLLRGSDLLSHVQFRLIPDKPVPVKHTCEWQALTYMLIHEQTISTQAHAFL